MSRISMFLVALAIAVSSPGARASSPTTETGGVSDSTSHIVPPATRPFGPRTYIYVNPEPQSPIPFAPAPGQIVPGAEPIPRNWIRKDFDGRPFYIIPCRDC